MTKPRPLAPLVADARPRSQRSSADSDHSESSGSLTQGVGGEEKREQWGSNLAFLLASVGAAIGLGNVTRFPFLAYRYGGAAFLLPYAVALASVGLPLLGLEFLIGQRMRRGAVGAFAAISPRLAGIGVLAVYAAIVGLMSYNVLMAWTWVFIASSFAGDLPWAGLEPNPVTQKPPSQHFFDRTSCSSPRARVRAPRKQPLDD